MLLGEILKAQGLIRSADCFDIDNNKNNRNNKSVIILNSLKMTSFTIKKYYKHNEIVEFFSAEDSLIDPNFIIKDILVPVIDWYKFIAGIKLPVLTSYYNDGQHVYVDAADIKKILSLKVSMGFNPELSWDRTSLITIEKSHWIKIRINIES